MNHDTSQPWPFKPGERLLWEGAPDPAPAKTARRIARRLLFWAAFLSLVAAAWVVLRLTVIGEEIVVHPAISELEPFGFESKAADACMVQVFIVALLLVWPAFRMWKDGWRLRSTRCAITDCRALVRIGTKTQAASFANVPAVLWRADADGRRSFLVCLPPSKSALPAMPGGVGLGPFDPTTANAVESALRKANGLPPPDESADVSSSHRFPSWMDAVERKAILARLLPGERLLWCGRPDPTPSKTVKIATWMARLVLGAIGLWCLVGLVPTFPEHFSRSREILQVLFVGVGGPLGWLMGFVMALFAIFYFTAPFLLLAIPWGGRRTNRQYIQCRHLVTDRRAWTMRLGDKPGAMVGGMAIIGSMPAVARELGGRFSVAFLSKNGKALIAPRLGAFPAYGFAELSETDAHAAAEALGALRRANGHRDCGCMTCPGERP